MAITATSNYIIDPSHPSRFSVERDMSNGLYDVWDAYRCEYITCDVGRKEAENTAYRARRAIGSIIYSNCLTK